MSSTASARMVVSVVGVEVVVVVEVGVAVRDVGGSLEMIGGVAVVVIMAVEFLESSKLISWPGCSA